jgi:hypothetical protein
MPSDETPETFLKAAAERCVEAIKAARAARRAGLDQTAFRVAIRRATAEYHAALGEAARKFPQDVRK